MQRIFLAVNDNRVTCISTACKTADIFCVLCKVINNLTFSFITPLGTHYNNIHCTPLFCRIIAE